MTPGAAGTPRTEAQSRSSLPASWNTEAGLHEEPRLTGTAVRSAGAAAAPGSLPAVGARSGRIESRLRGLGSGWNPTEAMFNTDTAEEEAGWRDRPMPDSSELIFYLEMDQPPGKRPGPARLSFCLQKRGSWGPAGGQGYRPRRVRPG